MKKYSGKYLKSLIEIDNSVKKCNNASVANKIHRNLKSFEGKENMIMLKHI
jgi:hypothetical protein